MSVRLQIEGRFWSYVDWSANESACWPWVGDVHANGYGYFTFTDVHGHRTSAIAHRMAFELERGLNLAAIVDHLCHDPAHCAGGPTCPHRRCCNPWHLSAGTAAANLRPDRAHHRGREKTHCPRGHPYDEANTHRRANGSRDCRACGREKAREYRRRRAAEGIKQPLREACSKGHLFDEANTYMTPDGRPRCRTCHRENQRRYDTRSAR